MKGYVFMHQPFLKCFHCEQMHIVRDKLQLFMADLIVDSPDKLSSAAITYCFQCQAIRFINADSRELVKHSQYCNKCIELAKRDESVTVPAGEKMSWEDFLKEDGQNI
jgi:hypothetical protein